MTDVYVYHRTKAFNEGCQARLDGKPASANPYNSCAGTIEDSKHCGWHSGWLSVDHDWGRDVGGRWRTKSLPRIA